MQKRLIAIALCVLAVSACVLANLVITPPPIHLIAVAAEQIPHPENLVTYLEFTTDTNASGLYDDTAFGAPYAATGQLWGVPGGANNPTWASNAGYSAYIDGDGTDYIQTPVLGTNHYFNTHSQLTVAAWARKDGAHPQSSLGGIVARWQTAPNDSYLLYENTDQDVEAWINGSTVIADLNTDTPTQWVHYIMSYSGTQLKLYTNGTLSITTGYTTTVDKAAVAQLGMAFSSPGVFPWNGGIDTIMIWTSNYLDDAEVSTLWSIVQDEHPY